MSTDELPVKGNTERASVSSSQAGGERLTVDTAVEAFPVPGSHGASRQTLGAPQSGFSRERFSVDTAVEAFADVDSPAPAAKTIASVRPAVAVPGLRSSLALGGPAAPENAASRQTLRSAAGSVRSVPPSNPFSREHSNATVMDLGSREDTLLVKPAKPPSHHSATSATPAAPSLAAPAASTENAGMVEGSRHTVTSFAAATATPSSSQARARSAGATEVATLTPTLAVTSAASHGTLGGPTSRQSVGVSAPLPLSLTKMVAVVSDTVMAQVSPSAGASAAFNTATASATATATLTRASLLSPAGDASAAQEKTTTTAPSSRGKSARSVEIKTTPTVYETKMDSGDLAAARPARPLTTRMPWRLELAAQGVLSTKRGGAEVAVKGPDYVSHVRVQDGRAVLVEDGPVASPTSMDPRATRRQKSAFTIRRALLSDDPGPREPAVPALLVEHLDKVLPRGLRGMLLSLQNHKDLGVMATYAATLNRHKRLSSALEVLLTMQAGKQPTDSRPRTPPRTPQSRATAARSRWKRSLMFPFGLPKKPRPPPPLPPKHRPNLASLDKCLLDALEEAFRSDRVPASESQTCLAPQLQYSSRWAGDACRILAAYITRKLDLKRYKSACVVRIIEKRHQGFCSHFAAQWDAECDCFSCAVYETNSFIAYAILNLVHWD